MLLVQLTERYGGGDVLTPEEWSALVASYTAVRVPDYQMAALLMAVYFRGLERPELAALTDAMLASGQRLAFDGWATPRIDKHSTGGVGDKVSLVLAPLISACGVAVPMMSGRGLGHTGGTLDKLEAIPGFRTRLSLAETKAQVMKLLCAMIGQTPEIAPADLMEVTYALGVEMLLAAGLEKSTKQARNKLEGVLGAGLAAEKFEQVIEAQGGNPRAVEDPSVLPQAQAVEIFAARETGVVTRVEPRTIGRAIVAMGGGRRQVDDVIDPSVGFVITVKPGDKVLAGEPIASVFAKDAAGVELGLEGLERAIEMGDRLADKPLPLVSHRVTKDGVEELTAGHKPVKGR